MKKNLALIVIDMQRGFLEQGFPLFCGDGARRIIPTICRLIERELREGTSLFFTADAHAPNDSEFAIFPPHCVRGSAEAQIIPELAPYLDNAILIETTRYSAFFNTNLHQQLQQIGAIRLIVCGVCTDICVMHTAADAYYRNYAVEVRKDCVASFDETAHAFGLRHMEKVLGARITEETAQ
ncbi:MAG TPA: isochorismatase family cysteine hydrolase [Candidatus Heimdallarchaeota archaeon]|nr:isochorismatase family cysteine hydrolase [Candidatus Heimdallarchaeota archaeon]